MTTSAAIVAMAHQLHSAKYAGSDAAPRPFDDVRGRRNFAPIQQQADADFRNRRSGMRAIVPARC